MLGIPVEHQVVLQLNLRAKPGALSAQRQRDIGPIGMGFDLEAARAELADLSVHAGLEMRERVSGNGRLTVLDFTPGDTAVRIPVQPQLPFEIAYRNIPSTLDGLSGHIELQITVAGLVGLGRAGHHQPYPVQPPAARRAPPRPNGHQAAASS